jgi:serine/threonine protein kinase
MPSLAPGDKLGPYEILALIGKGGMGEVYRARDTRLNRDVAVKVSTSQFTERFDREARAVAALNHPNICTLHDVGPNYLVMEYIEGEAPRGPLPLEEALRIAHQIADALEAAHEKGITHRDLKPANIKIRPDGTVKVLDFGLAKTSPPSEGGVGEDSPTLSMAATQAGVILGTAAYMSPEQARGKPVGKRADIWAFGVVLYELITGKRLFKGEDASHIMAAVIMQEPQLDAVPVPIQRMLKACLEKDPKKRLRDIGDVWRLMEESNTALQPVPTQVKSPSRWIWPSIAAVLVAALAAVSFLHFRETVPSSPAGRFDVPLPMNNGTVGMLSPDGSSLAFVSNQGGPNRIWVRPLNSLEARALPGTDDATYPFWSPDGATLGFFAQGKLKTIALAGGPVQTLCPAPTPRGAAWNRDGTIVFAPNVTGGLYRVSDQGGDPVQITKPSAGDNHSQRYPEFILGGKNFLFAYQNGPTELSGIYVGSLDGTPPVRILPDPSRAVYVPPGAGSHAGRLLFLRESTLMALPFDPEKLRAAGAVVPLVEDVGSGPNSSFGAFSASENGVLAYRTGTAARKTKLAWLDGSGKEEQVIGEPDAMESLALSPDGRHSAVSIRSSGQVADIWLRDLERGVPGKFTFGSGLARFPVWSPDGYLVYVNSPTPGTYDFYRKAADGTGQEELLLHAGINGNPYDISSDGKLLVYSETGAQTKDDLWLLPLAAGGRKPVKYLDSAFDERLAQFSPDGKWMAYQSDESGQYQVYVQPIPATGAKHQISVMGGTRPRWRRDGKQIFYISTDRKMMAADVKSAGATFESGTPQPLFDFAPPQQARAFGYQPTADGKKFLAIVPVEGEAGAPPPVTVWLNWQAGFKK